MIVRGSGDLLGADVDALVNALGYTNWLGAMLAGSIDEYYGELRWPGWQQEVAAVPPNELMARHTKE